MPAYAFYGNTFTSITFGESVKSVGQEAFSHRSGSEIVTRKIVILSKSFTASTKWGDVASDCEIYYAGTPDEMLANFTVGANNIHWFKDKVHYFYSETGTEPDYTGAEGWTYGGLWHYVDGRVTKW